METKILVTGAAGPIGTGTVKRLLEMNLSVRAMVHKIDERSEALAALGAEIVVGDMREFNSVSAAMKGITRTIFIYPVAEGLLQATAYLAQAATEENVSLILNVSQRTSVRNATSHSAQDHWLAERMLDRSGVPVIHLQPTLFMEWLIYFADEIKEKDRYISPFAETRYGTISGEDIGKTAAALLAKPEDYIGKTIQIYGPEEITGYDAAEALSNVLKRKITYTPIAPDQFGTIMYAFGAPDYQIKHIVAVSKMFNSGSFTGMNNNVETITGNKPMSITDYIIQNVALFQ